MFKVSSDLLKDWKVLVVDDEVDSLLVAQMLLERCGARVVTANNGKEALTMAEKHRPRFVLSDLSMPVMDGWGFNAEMQKDPALREIPVIALTAHAMQGDREKAMAAGFHNYLTKPLMPKTFIQNLLKLLLDVPELQEDLNKHVEESKS